MPARRPQPIAPSAHQRPSGAPRPSHEAAPRPRVRVRPGGPWLALGLLAAWVTAQLWSPTPAVAGGPASLAAIQKAAPGCAQEATHCYGLRLHVVVKGNEPVQTPTWVAEQVREANERWAGTGIGFELQEVLALPARMAHVRNKADRDKLGQRRFKNGVIDVFLVEQLDNIDAPGEINGVHWRNRDDRRQRWIIMSKIAWHVVLAHELGHFFGLPHSEHPASIMNKSRDKERPPLEEWSFHEDERKTIEVQRQAMTRTRYILDRRAPVTPPAKAPAPRRRRAKAAP